MTRHRPDRRKTRSGQPSRKIRGAYVLILRGSDDRIRVERFDDAQAYRTRLAALRRTGGDSLSIDEIADLLDA